MSNFQVKQLVIQIICAHDDYYSSAITMMSLEDIFYFLVLVDDEYRKAHWEPFFKEDSWLTSSKNYIQQHLLAAIPLEPNNLDCHSVLKHSKLYRTGGDISIADASFVKFPCLGISKLLYQIALKYPLNWRLHKLFNQSVWLAIKLRLLKYKLLRYVYFYAAQRKAISAVLDLYLLKDAAAFKQLKSAAEAVN
jgi:hypothetical protein